MARKGLSRIASLMSHKSMNAFYKLPTADLIESIILTSQGDIRNAVINLHFASQKGIDRFHNLSYTFFALIVMLYILDSVGLSTELANKSSKKSRTEKKKKLKSVGCDESITLFHALGRVFNPKCKLSTLT